MDPASPKAASFTRLYYAVLCSLMIVFHFTNKAAMDEGRAKKILCALKLLIFQVSELRTAENNVSFTQDEPVPTCVWRERSLTSGLMVNIRRLFQLSYQE